MHSPSNGYHGLLEKLSSPTLDNLLLQCVYGGSDSYLMIAALKDSLREIIEKHHRREIS